MTELQSASVIHDFGRDSQKSHIMCHGIQLPDLSPASLIDSRFWICLLLC